VPLEAGGERRVLIFDPDVGRERDGWSEAAPFGRQVPDAMDQVVAVLPWHGNVADQHVDLMEAEQVERLDSGTSRHDFRAMLLEQRREESTRIPVIIHDQNAKPLELGIRRVLRRYRQVV